MEDLIDVNENYEIEYRYSKEDESYEDFYRNQVITLLSKDKNKTKDRKIIWADNCHNKTGKWPMHLHSQGSKCYFLYLGGSFEHNWENFKGSFINEAVKVIGEFNRKDLEKSFDKIKFLFEQKYKDLTPLFK